MARHLGTVCTVLVLFLCESVGQAQAPRPAAKEILRPVTIARAIMDLSKEGHDAWDKQKPWPREESNYAAKMAVTVPNADVARVLGQQLDSNATIDAYIKWQLLSFHPDLNNQTPAAYRRIIALLPKLLAQPEPNLAPPAGAPSGGGMSVGAQATTLNGLQPIPGTRLMRPTLGVVSAGTGLTTSGTVSADGRYVATTIEAAQTELLRLKEITVDANAVPVLVRNAVIDSLPSDGGIRIAAMIADLKARMVAAEPSYTVAADRLVAECQKTGPMLTISAEFKGPILGGLRELARMHASVVTGVGIDASGSPGLQRQPVALRAEQIKSMVEDLNLGEEFMANP